LGGSRWWPSCANFGISEVAAADKAGNGYTEILHENRDSRWRFSRDLQKVVRTCGKRLTAV
jgi:hypothetical protein